MLYSRKSPQGRRIDLPSKNHEISGRRNSLRTVSAVGIAFVIVIFLVPSTVSAKAPIYSLHPPFAGNSSVYVFNQTGLSPCAPYGANVSRGPALNLTSGRISLALHADTLRHGTCLRHSQIGDWELGVVSYSSPRFTMSVWGNHIVRSFWSLHESVNASMHFTGKSSNAGETYSRILLYINEQVQDLKTGTIWSSAPAFSNSTVLSGFGTQRVNESGKLSLSLPLTVPLTKGDPYQFSVVVYAETDAYAYLPGGWSSASLTLDPNGHGSYFEGFSIH
jgi:hypothetical protein